MANGDQTPSVNNLLRPDFPANAEDAAKRRDELLHSVSSPLTHKNQGKDAFDQSGNKRQALPGVYREFVVAEKLADQIKANPAIASALVKEIDNEQKYLPGEADANGAWHTYDRTLKDLLDSSAVVRVSLALRLLEAAKADNNQVEQKQLKDQAKSLLAEACQSNPNFLNDERLQKSIQKLGLEDDVRQLQAQSQGQVLAAQSSDRQVGRRQNAIGDGSTQASSRSAGDINITEGNKGVVSLDIAQKALRHYMDACKQGANPKEALMQTERAFQQAIKFAGNGDANTQAMRQSYLQGELNRGIDPITGKSCSPSELAERGKLALTCSNQAYKMARAMYAIALNNAGENERAIQQVQPYAVADGDDLASRVCKACSKGQVYSGEYAQKYVEQKMIGKFAEPIGNVGQKPAPAPEATPGSRAAMPPVAPERTALTLPPVAYGKKQEAASTPVAAVAPEGQKVGGETPAANTTAAGDRLQNAVNDFQQTKNLNHQEFIAIIKEREAATEQAVKDIEDKRDLLKGTIVKVEHARVEKENKLAEDQKQLQVVTETLAAKQRGLNDIIATKAALDKKNDVETKKLTADKSDWGRELGNVFDHSATSFDSRQAALNKDIAASKAYDVQIGSLQAEIQKLPKAKDLQASIDAQAKKLEAVVQDLNGKRAQVEDYWKQLDKQHASSAEAMAKYAQARVAAGMTEGADGNVTQDILRTAALYNPQLLKDESFKQQMQAAHLDSVAEAKTIADTRRSFARPFDQVYYAFDSCRAEGFTKDGMDFLKQVKEATGTPSAEAFKQLQANLANAVGNAEASKAIQKEMLAPVLSRLAVAAAATQARDSKTFNDMVKEINALPKSADMQTIINKAIEYAKHGEMMSQKQIAESVAGIRTVQTNQERGAITTGSAPQQAGLSRAGQEAPKDGLKEFACQTSGDIFSGLAGWGTSTALYAPLTGVAVAATAAAVDIGLIASAPVWLPAALAVGAAATIGIGVTLGYKYIWNHATQTGEQDPSKSWYYDIFNYGTFGASTGFKFAAKEIAKTALIESVKKTAFVKVAMPFIAKTTTEASLFVTNLAAKSGWLGKAAQEASQATKAARELWEQKAKEEANKAIAEQLTKHAGNPNADKIAEAFGKAAHRRVMRDMEKAVAQQQLAVANAAKAALIGAKVYGVQAAAKPVLNVQGVVVNYARSAAKMAPASMTFATGRALKDYYHENKSLPEVGVNFVTNSGSGIVGGGALGAGGEFISKLPGASKVASVATSAIEKTPVLKEVAAGLAKYPPTQGSAGAIFSESLKDNLLAAPEYNPVTPVKDYTKGTMTSPAFWDSGSPDKSPAVAPNDKPSSPTPAGGNSSAFFMTPTDNSAGVAPAGSDQTGAANGQQASPEASGVISQQAKPETSRQASPEQSAASDQSASPNQSTSQPPTTNFSDF
jgi:hypothetical protein